MVMFSVVIQSLRSHLTLLHRPLWCCPMFPLWTMESGEKGSGGGDAHITSACEHLATWTHLTVREPRVSGLWLGSHVPC